MNARDFAVAVLQGLNAPVTNGMIDFMVRWEASEGGAWHNAEKFNPLNVAAYDSNPTNPHSVMPNWATGIAATISVINQSNFSDLAAGIRSGDPSKALQALIASPWASSHYGGGSAFPSSAGSYGSTALSDDGSTNVSWSGGGNTAPSAFPAATPSLSLDSLRSTAPLVAALVSAVPELKSIFQQAVSGSWSTDKFISAVQNSNWWATHSDAARQALATQQTDPATWQKQVSQLETTLTSMAAQVGALPSNQQLYNLAIDALTNGYDTNQAVLRQKFAQFVSPVSGLHFGGEAGGDETQLRQSMMDLGVFLPEKQLDQNLRNIIGGTTDVNSVTAQLRTQAAAAYPAYAQQINQGMNVSSIADPYIQQAQQILEKGPGEINILNPMIKKALQNTVDGKPAPLSLTDFEIQARQNPAWRATNNAQTSVMSTAHQVLQQLGFAF